MKEMACSQKVYYSSNFFSEKVCCLGVAPSSSKFYPRVAHKRCATLEKHLPSPNSTPGLLTKQRPATLEWQLLPLNFALARLTKSLLRWNVSFRC